MAFHWNWIVFIVATIICSILVMYARGSLNGILVAKHGPKAHYAAEPGAAIAGSILAGAVYAAIVTVIAGFVF